MKSNVKILVLLAFAGLSAALDPSVSENLNVRMRSIKSW